MQFEDAGAEGTFAEEGKIVDEEVDSKKKLDLRKKDLLNQLHDTSNACPDMPQLAQGMLKEAWQQELQDIERRRNDLLPEDQKMQKTQKLQSSQDKKEQMGWRK